MLDIVFGENGLMEAEDKKDLKEKVIACGKLLTDIKYEGVKLDSSSSWKIRKIYHRQGKNRVEEAYSKCKKEGNEDQ